MWGGPALRGLRQVSLGVADLDAVFDFYADVLELPLLGRYGPLAFFELGGTRLLLEEQQDPASSVLYFGVEDIDATRAMLEARGVSFEDEPHVIHRDDDGTFGPAGEEEWMTFFRDPAGNLLALSSRRAPG